MPIFTQLRSYQTDDAIVNIVLNLFSVDLLKYHYSINQTKYVYYTKTAFKQENT